MKKSNADRGVYQIVNFNFDDLLVNKLRSNRIKTTPIFKPGKRDANLSVLHPHGYLPRTGPIPTQALVFTEDDYNKITVEPFNWATTEIANILRSSVVMFIGLSMTDPNIRRMLDACRTQKGLEHYVVRRKYSDQFINMNDAVATVQRLAEVAQSNRGTSKSGNDKSDGDVSNAIGRVLRQAKAYDDRLFADMGVGVLWMDDFSDVPELVKRISS